MITLIKKFREKLTHYQELRDEIESLKKCLAEKENESKVKESAVAEHLSVLETDCTELFRRVDQLQKQADERISILETDRTELFHRVDQLREQADERISILEKDRTELFERCDGLFSNLTDRQQEDTLSTIITLQNSITNIWENIPTPRKESMVRIHFIRCLDIYNTGDMNCGPEQYFQELLIGAECFFYSLKNIRYDLIGEHDWVILGGGGLLDCSWQYQRTINRLLMRSDHVVGWSLGHNKHSPDSIYAWEANIPVEYTRFLLFTTRDWNYQNNRYCPCVSCMMRGLEKTYEKKRRIGVLSHHEVHINDFSEDICDNSQPIEDVLEFIGSSEIIITNTFHGAYWSTLMNKRVILYQPFSNRFEFFKYPPVVYSGDLEADIARAKTYPNALEECRRINIELKDELLKLITES